MKIKNKTIAWIGLVAINFCIGLALYDIANALQNNYVNVHFLFGIIAAFVWSKIEITNNNDN